GLPPGTGGEEYAKLDSDTRYWAMLMWGIGLGMFYLVFVTGIEHGTLAFRLLGFPIFLAGFARFISAARTKQPPKGQLIVALIAELVVIPVLLYWQSTIALD